MKKESIGHDIKITSNMIARKLNAIRIAHGNDNITRMQGRIICYIYEHPERELCQRDIKEFLSVSPPTAAKMLRLMEDDGLIVRTSVKGDARLKHIELTERSKAICPRIFDELNELEDVLRSGLTPDEAATLIELLGKVRDAVS